MKKSLFIIFILIIFILVGCSQGIDDSNIEIRFYNLLTEFDGDGTATIGYGISYGEVVYEGALEHGEMTNYYHIDSGEYYLKFKDSYGNWHILSDELWHTPYVSGKYTIYMEGTDKEFKARYVED